MTAATVTLYEVLAASAIRHASLVPETSGYLVLAICDATARLPFRVSDQTVMLSTEGTVSVARGATIGDAEVAHVLRALLARLLGLGVGSMPGLTSAARARTNEDRGLAGVVADLEGALIPVNRAAARRALARLARETVRAKESGKLAPPRNDDARAPMASGFELTGEGAVLAAATEAPAPPRVAAATEAPAPPPIAAATETPAPPLVANTVDTIGRVATPRPVEAVVTSFVATVPIPILVAEPRAHDVASEAAPIADGDDDDEIPVYEASAEEIAAEAALAERAAEEASAPPPNDDELTTLPPVAVRPLAMNAASLEVIPSPEPPFVETPADAMTLLRTVMADAPLPRFALPEGFSPIPLPVTTRIEVRDDDLHEDAMTQALELPTAAAPRVEVRFAPVDDSPVWPIDPTPSAIGVYLPRDWRGRWCPVDLTPSIIGAYLPAVEPRAPANGANAIAKRIVHPAVKVAVRAVEEAPLATPTQAAPPVCDDVEPSLAPPAAEPTPTEIGIAWTCAGEVIIDESALPPAAALETTVIQALIGAVPRVVRFDRRASDKPRVVSNAPITAQLAPAKASRVDDLLDRFGTADVTSEAGVRAIAASLKGLAGLELTPAPSSTLAPK